MIRKAEQIKELRRATGAGVQDCMNAWKTADGDIEKAREILIQKFGEKAVKKFDRVTNEGMIAHYVHANRKMGAMVVLKCETDFVAKNELFVKLANDIALHIGATNPGSIDELMQEPFIKDASVTIKEYIHRTIGKLGENIVIEQFSRFSI